VHQIENGVVDDPDQVWPDAVGQYGHLLDSPDVALDRIWVYRPSLRAGGPAVAAGEDVDLAKILEKWQEVLQHGGIATGQQNSPRTRMRWRRITGFSGLDLGPTQDAGPPGAQAIEVNVGGRDMRDAWRRIHREQPQTRLQRLDRFS
jgi:hypothetical protein